MYLVELAPLFQFQLLLTPRPKVNKSKHAVALYCLNILQAIKDVSNENLLTCPFFFFIKGRFATCKCCPKSPQGVAVNLYNKKR